MEKRPFICSKCQNTTFTQDRFRAVGGFFSRLFNLQHKKFITISCNACGYTELYKTTTSTGENVLDFLFGG